jgi:23S rRNA (uracil-5-)-methyltransferase RumA
METTLQELSDKLQGLPLEGTLTGFLHIVNDSLADVVQSDVTNLIYGKDWFCEEILGLQFRITPFSFFQTNTRGAELLYQKAREYVLNNGQTNNLQGKVIYDLYSGTGTIAQILAPVAGKVIGVEIVEEAVAAARENAARNGLQNCEFIAGDVLKVLDEISEKPDFIVLDPPRDGIHPKALKRIIEYGVPRLVYISCKPTSLARDLVVMQEAGYRVERACNVDLFANTVHCETVILLSQQKSDDRIEVDV